MTSPTSRLFDTWALNGRAEGMEAGHEPRAIQAIDAIPLAAGETAIDLGCGNGWATRALADRLQPGGSAIGIDIAPAMVERAQAASAGRDDVRFVCASFEAMPFDDGSVDHAFSMEALYYALDLHEALLGIRRVLRPGGTLTLATDFFLENPYSHGWPEMMGIPMELLGEAGWRQAMERAGFHVEQSFRCYDPRPVDPSREDAADVEHFRREIGALAVRARALPA